MGCEDYSDHSNAQKMCEELDDIAKQSEIDAQYSWLAQSLKEYYYDSSVAWIVASIHMAPYTSGTGDGDLSVLKKRLVPLLMDYEVDLLITGHVHLMEHYFLDSKSLAEGEDFPGLGSSTCVDNYYAGSTSFTSTQGEGLHQMLIGASGRELDSLCIDDSFGASKLLFAEDKYGFTELYIDSTQLDMKYWVTDVTDPIFESKIYAARREEVVYDKLA